MRRWSESHILRLSGWVTQQGFANPCCWQILTSAGAVSTHGHLQPFAPRWSLSYKGTFKPWLFAEINLGSRILSVPQRLEKAPMRISPAASSSLWPPQCVTPDSSCINRSKKDALLSYTPLTCRSDYFINMLSMFRFVTLYREMYILKITDCSN